MALAAIFAAEAGLAASPSLEDAELLARWSGRVRLGPEFELDAGELARFVRNFDLEAFSPEERRRILETAPADILDEYLDSWAALQGLRDPEVWARLTAGLGALAPPALEGPRGATRTGGILIPGAGPPVQGPGQAPVKIGSDGPLIVLPAAKEPAQEAKLDPRAARELAQAEHRHDWAILQQRWRALPLEAKRESVRLSRLPARWVAETVVTQGMAGRLKARSDVSPEVARLLGRMEWDDFGSYVEFRYREDFRQLEPRDYLEDVDRFAGMAGIGRELQLLGDPHEDAIIGLLREKRLQADPVSYHNHFSAPGRDLTGLAEGLNLFKLFHFQGRGGKPMQRTAQVAFRRLAYKGLVRLIGKDRIESRYHSEPPRAELLSMLRYLEEPRRLYADLARQITVSSLRSILAEAPVDSTGREERPFFTQLQGFLERCPDCRVASPEVVAFLEERLASGGAEEQLKAVLALDSMRGGGALGEALEAKVDGRLRQYLRQISEAPADKWSWTLAGALADRDPRVIEPAFLEMLSSPNAKSRGVALVGLGRARTPESLRKLASLLDDPDREVARNAAELLKDFDLPMEIREAIARRLDSPDWFTQQMAFRALLPTADPPTLRRLVALLEQPRLPPSMLESLVMSLQGANRPELKEVVLPYLFRRNPALRGAAVQILSRYGELPTSAQRAVVAAWPNLTASQRDEMLVALTTGPIDPLALRRLQAHHGGEARLHERIKSWGGGAARLQRVLSPSLPSPGGPGCLNGNLVQLRRRLSP